MKACMQSRPKLLGLAVAATLGVGVVNTAQAGVFGQSLLEVTNFVFTNGFNGTIVNQSQLDVLVFNDSTLGTASLNGAPPSAFVLNQNNFGTLDAPTACQSNTGACGVAPFTNGGDYTSKLARTAGTNVAFADTLLRGAPIINTAGVSTPADAHVVNEGQLQSGTSANTQANLGLTASFSFSLTNDQAVTIDLNALTHLISTVDLGSSGTSRASDQWTVEIRDHNGTLVFSWSPNGGAGGISGPAVGAIVGGGATVENVDTCDLNRTVNAQLPGQTSSYDCTGREAATTNILLASETYTLGLRHAGAVDLALNAVPEPGTLLLLGAGLMGIGIGSRRSKYA